MADQIVVMHDGVVEQMGRRSSSTIAPHNLFVAGFIGSPAMNFLKGNVKANGSASFEARRPEAAAGFRARQFRRPAGGVRRQARAFHDRRRRRAEAEIVVVEPTGSETQVFAKLGGEQVVAVFRERHQFNPGDRIRLKPTRRWSICSMRPPASGFERSRQAIGR